MFQACEKLTSINIPNSVTTIGDYAFYYTGLTSVAIPGSVTKLGPRALKQTRLTSLTIPGNVKNIERALCAFCTKLTSVKICEGIKFIDIDAFQDCWVLETVSLPASLDSITDGAFANCPSLKVIECNSTNPPAMHPDVFNNSNITETSVCVPSGSVDAYKNAPVWKNFKNIGTYPAGIHLDKHSITIKGNETVKLNAYVIQHDAIQSVKWHTKNIGVAEVNNGIIKFKAAGTAAIVATTHNGIFRDSCFIRVLDRSCISSEINPTLVDSLLGVWVQCDKNLQALPNPERLEFRKVVVATAEGYEIYTYEGANIWNDWNFQGSLEVDEVNRTFKVTNYNNASIKGQILELTENTLKDKDLYSPAGEIYSFVRTK
jgi:hypothetical protein